VDTNFDFHIRALASVTRILQNPAAWATFCPAIVSPCLYMASITTNLALGFYMAISSKTAMP